MYISDKILACERNVHALLARISEMPMKMASITRNKPAIENENMAYTAYHQKQKEIAEEKYARASRPGSVVRRNNTLVFIGIIKEMKSSASIKLLCARVAGLRKYSNNMQCQAIMAALARSSI